MFKLYDKDNSGSLSSFEIRRALNSAGYRLNTHILNAITLRYGQKDGTVSFDDFILIAVKLKTMIGKSKSQLIAKKTLYWFPKFLFGIIFEFPHQEHF